jgi:hypothetical protein
MSMVSFPDDTQTKDHSNISLQNYLSMSASRQRLIIRVLTRTILMARLRVRCYVTSLFTAASTNVYIWSHCLPELTKSIKLC